MTVENALTADNEQSGEEGLGGSDRWALLVRNGREGREGKDDWNNNADCAITIRLWSVRWFAG